MDKTDITNFNELLDDKSIDIDKLVYILNAIKKPIKLPQQQKEKKQNCKRLIRYFLLFFYNFPLNLFGYQQYLEDDISKCFMYAITLGFMGFGVLFDYFILAFISKTSKLYTLIRKIYSFVFIIMCISLFSIDNTQILSYLLLLFICNEIGLFYTILISVGRVYINDLTIIIGDEEENDEKVKYFSILSVILIICWSLDIRITDIPFKKIFMKLIMAFSFVYHFYFLILRDYFPEKITIIYFNYYFNYYYNKYNTYKELYIIEDNEL